MTSIAKIFLALVALALLAACSGHQAEHSAYAQVDADGWDYGDTLRLVVDSPIDSVVSGRMAIAVRHTADYDYRNLWLELSYSDSIAPDTVDVELADVYGNWHGTGLGLSYQTVDTLERRIDLAAPVTIHIRHIMRVDRLNDIEQIGVIII